MNKVIKQSVIKQAKLSARLKQAILVFVYFCVPFSGLGLDLYAPSLPAISHVLMVHPQLVQLTMTVYLLSFSLGQLLIGPLTDYFGRRLVILGGLLVQSLLLVAIIYNRSIELLLLLRFLQGLCVAAMVVPARAMIADLFHGKAFNKYINYMTLCWAAGPVFAPWIGSHLQHTFGWQACFIFMLIYVLSLLLFAMFILRETHYNRSKSLSMRQALKGYLFIMRDVKFTVSFIIMGLSFGVFYLYVIMAPFIIQHVLGYTPLVFGRVTLSLGVMLFIGNMSNRLLTFMPGLMRIRVAVGMMFISMLVFLLLCYMVGMPLWVLWIPHLFFVCGLGLSVPPLAAQALAEYRSRAGLSNALFFAGGWVVSALVNYIGSWVNPTNIMLYATLDAGIAGLILLMFFLVLLPRYAKAHV